MLTVDRKLKGRAICIRPSMTKFEAPPSLRQIEIARAFDRPSPFYLTRPLIMVPEGLGCHRKFLSSSRMPQLGKLWILARPKTCCQNARNLLSRNFVSTFVHYAKSPQTGSSNIMHALPCHAGLWLAWLTCTAIWKPIRCLLVSTI